MTLEELFAGNSWRVIDTACDPDRTALNRFAVVATAPGTFGAQVEICAVQYRPHADAIAALPEAWEAIALLCEAIRSRHSLPARSEINAAEHAVRKARSKAEGGS